MTVDELIEKLKRLSDNGKGATVVLDSTWQPIEEVFETSKGVRLL